MKTKKLFLAILLLCLFFAKSQTAPPEMYDNSLSSIFENLEKDKIPNGLLLDAAVEFVNFKKYDGTIPDSSYTRTDVITGIYNTLLLSRLSPSAQIIKTSEEFVNDWKSAQQTDIIPLGGVLYKYGQFSQATNQNALNTGDPGTVTVNNGILYDKYIDGEWQNPYEEKKVFAISPSVNSHNKFNFIIKLPDNLFLTNISSQIHKLEYKLSDTDSYQLLPFNQFINVSYTAEGIYNWTFKLTLNSGEVLYTHTQFIINGHLDQYSEVRDTTSKTTTLDQYTKKVISYENAKATLYIKLAPGHAQITNPLIVAEGFDMGNVVKPSQEAGFNNIDNFISSLKYDYYNNTLQSFITQNTDIIYVDWNNGVDYIQNNAELLKRAILYVNLVKVGTNKNIVLGQSMGGLVARFALKDMEDTGLNHDTKLFISHDSPHQGANIPIGLQYMLRNLAISYMKAPGLAGIGQIIVPVFNQGITIGDVLTLTDVPAARQMLINYVNKNYQIDNTLHNNWQAQLQAKGYPQQTRNVAISNGSECGTDQALDNLMRFYKETNQQHLFSDIIGVLLGGFSNNLGLISLASLPGSSKYIFDFTIRPITNINENKQLYYGNIKYKKKVLWLINAQATLLNGSKNQPSGILPIDKYGGGKFELLKSALPSSLQNDLSVKQFAFIPTPSAIDYKFGNNILTEADYQKSYSPTDDATQVPFANFVAEKADYNNTHISFSSRNGQFIINQFSTDPAIQNTKITETYLCGDKVKVGGDNLICDNNIHTYTVGFAPYISWSVLQGSELIDVESDNISPQFKIRKKDNANGLVILQAILSGNGSNTITKKIWIGKPKIYIDQIFTNFTGRISLSLKSAVTGATLEDQGITASNVTWYRPTQNITKTGGFSYSFLVNNNVIYDFDSGYPVQVTVSNSCGNTVESAGFIPDIASCGYNITKTNGNSYYIIDPCPFEPPIGPYSTNITTMSSNSSNPKLQNLTTKIFNSMGVQVLSTNNLQFSLDNLMIGTYYVKVFKNGNIVHSQTLLKN